MKRQILTAEVIEAFSGMYLSPRYDQPQPTPEFHRECWHRYCSFHPACATAAPRNHAKSTGLTHDYILANVCFAVEDYIILVGSSEEMAIEHLGDIANELKENDDLIRDFKIRGFIQDQKTDIIVERTDGTQFRILARGAEQKIRGRKWNGKRPGLIVCDDLEDDEQVENSERRKKFRRWFFRACKQALRDGGRIRMHGTVLHVDSLLAHVLKNKSWNSKTYKAHRSFSDFSEILWPEKFPEIRLRSIQKEFVDEGDSAGYSQEYLNDPRDDENAYLKKEYLLPMERSRTVGEDEINDYESWKTFIVGCDWASSETSTANQTAFVIVGIDTLKTRCVVDVRYGRWGPEKIIEEMIEIEQAYHPKGWGVEKGQIWNILKPFLVAEMMKEDLFPDFIELPSSKDKGVRGKPFQKQARARRYRFDKEASWYPYYEGVMLDFKPESEAIDDDVFDGTTIAERAIVYLGEPEEGDDASEEEQNFDLAVQEFVESNSRNSTTGY